ncbi:MAG: VTT domain-containing protein [Candidatus Taylorbacteria bacterium]
MNLPALIISFATSHALLVYILIYILAIAEGPFLAMIMGVLIRLGHFYFIPIYLIIMCGNLTGDIVLYYAGMHYGDRFIKRMGGKYLGITEERVEKMKLAYTRYHEKILFFSKISNGLGFAVIVLFTAGIVRVRFTKFMFINIIGEGIWTGMLMCVGLFFSNWYIQVNNIFGRIGIVTITIFIGYVLYRIIKNLRTKAENASL